MMRSCWIVAASVAVACGDPGPNDDAASGERLRLVRWDVGDASTLADVLYDTALGAHCQPTTAPYSGPSECVPLELDRRRGSIVFADAGCLQPIILADRDIVTRFAIEERVGRRGYPRSIVTIAIVAAPTSPELTTYFAYRADLAEQQHCEGPFAVPVALTTYQVGERIEDVVALPLGAPRGEGPVRWRYLESSDGARYPATLFDSVANVDCVLEDQPFGGSVCTSARSASAALAVVETGAGRLRTQELRGDGTWLRLPRTIIDGERRVACRPVMFDELRCVPWYELLVGAFSDPGCTNPIEVADASGASPILVAASPLSRGLLFEAEARSEPSYELRDGTCRVLGPVVQAGAAVELMTLPAMAQLTD